MAPLICCHSLSNAHIGMGTERIALNINRPQSTCFGKLGLEEDEQKSVNTLNLRTDRSAEKVVSAVLSCALDTITERLANRETVELTGFGKFDLTARPAYHARHPTTGEMIDYPAEAKPIFKPGKAFDSAVR